MTSLNRPDGEPQFCPSCLIDLHIRIRGSLASVDPTRGALVRYACDCGTVSLWVHPLTPSGGVPRPYLLSSVFL